MDMLSKSFEKELNIFDNIKTGSIAKVLDVNIISTVVFYSFKDTVH